MSSLGSLSPEHPGRRSSTAPAWLYSPPAPWDDPGHPGTPVAAQTHLLALNKHT